MCLEWFMILCVMSLSQEQHYTAFIYGQYYKKLIAGCTEKGGKMFLNRITENLNIDHAYSILPKGFTKIDGIAKYIRITHT